MPIKRDQLLFMGLNMQHLFLGDREIINNDFTFLLFIYLKFENEGAPRVK